MSQSYNISAAANSVDKIAAKLRQPYTKSFVLTVKHPVRQWFPKLTISPGRVYDFGDHNSVTAWNGKYTKLQSGRHKALRYRATERCIKTFRMIFFAIIRLLMLTSIRCCNRSPRQSLQYGCRDHIVYSRTSVSVWRWQTVPEWLRTIWFSFHLCGSINYLYCVSHKPPKQENRRILHFIITVSKSAEITTPSVRCKDHLATDNGTELLPIPPLPEGI